jgi:hypothetical protein
MIKQVRVKYITAQTTPSKFHKASHTNTSQVSSQSSLKIYTAFLNTYQLHIKTQPPTKTTTIIMQFNLVTLASAALLTSLAAAAPATGALPAGDITIQLKDINEKVIFTSNVPANGKPFSLGTVLNVFSAQIINGGGLRQPSCLSFTDEAATEFATELSFTTTETELLLGSKGTVKVGAVECESL